MLWQEQLESSCSIGGVSHKQKNTTRIDNGSVDNVKVKEQNNCMEGSTANFPLSGHMPRSTKGLWTERKNRHLVGGREGATRRVRHEEGGRSSWGRSERARNPSQTSGGDRIRV